MPNTQRLLELALKGLEAERASIDDEIANLKREANSTASHGPVPAISTTGGPAKKGAMSAAARKRISEGMKHRYAEMRSGQRSQTTKPASRGLTTAGRKKLSEMMKARWAAKKKAGKKAA